jgi:hypothetical protein
VCSCATWSRIPPRGREDLFVVIEQNAGIVHQRIEPIACSRKFFCCAPNALWFGDVDLQSGDCTASSIFGGAFLFSFAVKPLRRSLASLFVPGAEKNMKTFARQLPRNFKPDPFVRASHERDPSFFCHNLHPHLIPLPNKGEAEKATPITSAIRCCIFMTKYRSGIEEWERRDRRKSRAAAGSECGSIANQNRNAGRM